MAGSRKMVNRPSMRGTRATTWTLAVLTGVLTLAARAQEPAGEAMLLGEVIEVRADEETLTEAPLAGALVLLGRGILLDTGGDGRDAVVPSEDPALRPPVELAHTDDEGRFAVPLPPGEGSLDALVWKPGYTPVLRQGIGLGERAVFRLQAGAPSQLHVSLALPDGRLVLPALADRVGLPFVDAGLGLLIPLPAGYRRQGGSGMFTVAHFTDGPADVLILRAPSRLDPGDLAELLRQQTERTIGAPRLVRAHDVLLDGRRASWREFEGEDERAAMIYASRRNASIVILFAAPSAEFEARLAVFEEAIAAARFLGGPANRPESGEKVRARGLGVEMLFPSPWTVTHEDDGHLAARLGGAGVEFHLRPYADEGDLKQVATGAVAGLDTAEMTEPRWILVGGAPACEVTVEGRDPSIGKSLFRRAVAIQADREILLATFGGPSDARGESEEAMASVLDSVVFIGEK
jgi:hypothetical protein